MCRYHATTYSCGHTIHTQTRGSENCDECPPVPPPGNPTQQRTAARLCPGCANAGFRQEHTRPPRSPLTPSQSAINAHRRRRSNRSIPEHGRGLHEGIPHIIRAGINILDQPLRLFSSRQEVRVTLRYARIIFLFYGLLFCYLLLYTFSFFTQVLSILVSSWRRISK